MMESLRRVIARDLATLVRELELYPEDAALWRAVPGQPTAGGNLALHLVGNLRHFIGATLGGTGFVRDRDREFSSTGLTREALIAAVQAMAGEVDATLRSLDPQCPDEPFPLEIQGLRLPTEQVLVHLAGHLAFHLGQIDYHRRAATGDRTSAGPLALAPLEVR